MKRSERMAPVRRVLGNDERERARNLGAAQQQLADAERKLLDLQQYRSDYAAAFEQRARQGQSVVALRDFQLFMTRLDTAIQQQQQVVDAARGQLSGDRQRWQRAARQVKAVDSVVDRWQTEERRVVDRREQKESDERAQRGPLAGKNRMEDK
jgi:flagellar FliJ protein